MGILIFPNCPFFIYISERSSTNREWAQTGCPFQEALGFQSLSLSTTHFISEAGDDFASLAANLRQAILRFSSTKHTARQHSSHILSTTFSIIAHHPEQGCKECAIFLYLCLSKKVFVTQHHVLSASPLVPTAVRNSTDHNWLTSGVQVTWLHLSIWQAHTFISGCQILT